MNKILLYFSNSILVRNGVTKPHQAYAAEYIGTHRNHRLWARVGAAWKTCVNSERCMVYLERGQKKGDREVCSITFARYCLTMAGMRRILIIGD